MNRVRWRWALLALVAVAAAACAAEDPTMDAGASGGHRDQIAAEVASFDIVAGRADRFLVGVFGGDRQRLVGYGTVELSFRHLGEGDDATQQDRPELSTRGRFLPIPGQPPVSGGGAPRFVSGSEIIGVYAAPSVTFDQAGFWEVTVDAVIDGRERSTTAAFEVLRDSAIPAPGDPAPRSRQPLVGDDTVPAEAIDSRATADGTIPDPALHQTTIADALDAGRPVVVVVSTPTYCQSRFCGPITDSVHELAGRYGDRVAFVHLEVWRDFAGGVLNDAAADWIKPAGVDNGREPWVFTVGADGIITDRFDNVAGDAELEEAVRRLIAR
jgi:hypothetical protein